MHFTNSAHIVTNLSIRVSRLSEEANLSSTKGFFAHNYDLNVEELAPLAD